jgi:hypothetical protein
MRIVARREIETAEIHIEVRGCDIEIDQVTGIDGSRSYDFVCLGFTVDALEGWINSQHLCDITFQNLRLVVVREGLGDIGLFKEDVEHEGEGCEVEGMTLALGDR